MEIAEHGSDQSFHDDQTEYQVEVVVNRKRTGDRYPKRIARSGGTIHADSFSEAFDRLTTVLGDSWGKIAEMQHIADSDALEGRGNPE